MRRNCIENIYLNREEKNKGLTMKAEITKQINNIQIIYDRAQTIVQVIIVNEFP